MVRALAAGGHGVGIGLDPPSCLASHEWRCDGAPLPALVEHLRGCLRPGVGLPPAALLSEWPVLEASAARAIDLESPFKLAAILHADDPVLLGSSRGTLQCSLDVVAGWATTHGACFHASKEKRGETCLTAQHSMCVRPTVQHMRYPMLLPTAG